MSSRQEAVSKAWKDLIVALGYDTSDPHFKATPERVARFLAEWHTNGHVEPPVLTTFPNDGCDEIVAVGGVRFHSMCAHHGLPFFGTAAVGYLPKDSIVGLSKIARVVDYFARRFQTQETMTRNIGEYLEKNLAPHGVGVVVRAEHLCMSMRGIERPGHATITSRMSGNFRSSPEARAELLALLGER